MSRFNNRCGNATRRQKSKLIDTTYQDIWEILAKLRGALVEGPGTLTM
jgi:hypothetical protein